MKIAIDGGALCSPKTERFGTYTMGKGIVEELPVFDKANQYSVYVFCKPETIKLAENAKLTELKPTKNWMSMRVSWEEFRRPSNIFLALNQAIPMYTKAKVISFSHGLSFYFNQNLYPDSAKRMLSQVGAMIARSHHIVVSSTKVAKELRLMDSKVKVETIPFPVPKDMLDSLPLIPQRKNHFLFVGMDHAIKNLAFLTQAFQKFSEYNDNYELHLVGNFSRYASAEKRIYSHDNIDRTQLKDLYMHATAYLTASLYESYNLPVLEALSQNCPVIGLKSAIIPEFEDHVKVVKTLDEFVTAMKLASERPGFVSIASEIKKHFSWETYLKSLTALFV